MIICAGRNKRYLYWTRQMSERKEKRYETLVHGLNRRDVHHHVHAYSRRHNAIFAWNFCSFGSRFVRRFVPVSTTVRTVTGTRRFARLESHDEFSFLSLRHGAARREKTLRNEDARCSKIVRRTCVKREREKERETRSRVDFINGNAVPFPGGGFHASNLKTFC